MKKIIHILFIAVLVTLFSCQVKHENKEQITEKDTIITEPEELIDEVETKKQYENRQLKDSLRLDKILQDIFVIAKQNIELAHYYKEYKTLTYDSCYWVEVDILIGRLFSNKNKYLLIHRHNPETTYLDLYVIQNNKFKEIISNTYHFYEEAYIKDTIKDVNGDGLKDFLINLYSSSGCCRRDNYLVYLGRVKNVAFSEEYEFMNPTFFPKEKIIRGVGYGHPGEVGLYKYKWNGLKIDTIEYIYPNFKDTNSFIKTKKKSYRPTEEEGLKLKSVPKEYHNIVSYEWFIAY